MTSYLRPLALVFGPDARRLVADGEAAPLAGLSHIAFCKAELIVRDGGKVVRRIVELGEARRHSVYAKITAARPKFGPLVLDHSHVMGIVNVTPDSFSDGGVHFDTSVAIDEGRKMIDHGASLLDVGGESTRPGSEAVSIEEERRRIMPVIRAFAQDHIVSVDTRKAVLMHEALGAGAKVVNDVSALRHDPAAADVVAKAKAPIILMHAQGVPKTMQLQPKYDDVTLDIYDELAELISKAEAAGIARAHIMVDVGIGFGKTFMQNLELLQNLTLFHGLGVGMVVGLSRKAFIGGITGEKKAVQRLGGSVGGALQAAMMGAQMLRVHDVKETFTALQVFQAALDPPSTQV